MCRLVSYSYSCKGEVGGRERERERKASFRSLARSYCPLATLPLFGEEPRHYFGVVWTNNCLVCRYVLRADSRIVVFTVLGFRARRPVSIPSPKRREFSKCVFFFDIFKTISFFFFFLPTVNEIETSKVLTIISLTNVFLPRFYSFGLIFETRWLKMKSRVRFILRRSHWRLSHPRCFYLNCGIW